MTKDQEFVNLDKLYNLTELLQLSSTDAEKFNTSVIECVIDTNMRSLLFEA